MRKGCSYLSVGQVIEQVCGRNKHRAALGAAHADRRNAPLPEHDPW
jgi:hypothetical protein